MPNHWNITEIFLSVFGRWDSGRGMTLLENSFIYQMCLCLFAFTAVYFRKIYLLWNWGIVALKNNSPLAMCSLVMKQEPEGVGTACGLWGSLVPVGFLPKDPELPAGSSLWFYIGTKQKYPGRKWSLGLRLRLVPCVQCRWLVPCPSVTSVGPFITLMFSCSINVLVVLFNY